MSHNFDLGSGECFSIHSLLNSDFNSTNDLCVHSLVHFFTYSFPCATLLRADFHELDRALALETVGRQITGSTANWGVRSEAGHTVAAWWLRAGVSGDMLHWLDLFLAFATPHPIPSVSRRKHLLWFVEVCASPLGSLSTIYSVLVSLE